MRPGDLAAGSIVWGFHRGWWYRGRVIKVRTTAPRVNYPSRRLLIVRFEALDETPTREFDDWRVLPEHGWSRALDEARNHRPFTNADAPAFALEVWARS